MVGQAEPLSCNPSFGYHGEMNRRCAAIRGRIFSRSVGLWIWAALVASIPAAASQPGQVISQQTSSAVYQHYLEDLLYTHLGDNRGFGAQHDLARANIVSTLESFGLSVALEPFVYNSVTYYNIVATQPGTDNPSQTVVVGAHFDSVNNPGADDNATGTALVMEMARVLSQHRSSRRIRYCLFDREEQGRRGSIAYVAAHGADNTVWALTADMVGHDSGAYGMDLYSRASSSVVTNGVAAAIGQYGGGLSAFLNFGNYSFSDHWSFESANIPAVVIIERSYQLNTHYHQSTDAVDISPGYIKYPMVADLSRSALGYMVDTVPVSLWGDSDNDGDVDAVDTIAFRSCFGAGAVSGACYAFDRNLDGVVNCLDWPAFRVAHLASSGALPLPDLQVFVDVLIGTNTSAVDVCMSDVNGDNTANGADIAPYLQSLLP